MKESLQQDLNRFEMTEGEVEDLVSWRRHLHAHPELSNREFETAEYIRRRLAEFGIEQVETVADTGVVALVEGTAEGAEQGPTLGWRADIDALPILEENEVDYRSTNEGVMHACGHDVHTTVGLGIARRIHRRRDELAGRVKFIFQPAEEATPVDEPVGAEKMARAGVLEEPAVDGIFALHVMPKLAAGQIGYSGENVWAGSDLVEIEVSGKKAHGAMPHEGVDAGLVASQIAVSLQSIVSRRVDARESAVLSIGKMEAGNSYNILPERAEMTGILRCFSVDLASQLQEEIRRMATQVAKGYGATCEVTFTPGARPVKNDLDLQERAVAALEARFDDVAVAHPPQLAAEDFASFSKRVPGCYMFLGIRNEPEGIVHGLHTPEFDVDERCLTVGVGAMSRALLDVVEEA
jgi:amidohydrolase